MRLRSIGALTTAFILLSSATALASPVAQTKAERDLYGRTFLEPAASYSFIQFGEGGEGEFAGGMNLLEELFPRYLDFTTVAEQIGNEHAVSVGDDGLPSWHPDDSGDGLPMHAAIVTDTKVPDREKAYVALMASHQGEPCGREAAWRFVEDLLIAADEGSEETFDNGAVPDGETVEMTAAELLRKTKIYVLSPSPDGWRSGDGVPGLGYSQYNGAGINSNRVAYQDGWAFPPDPVLYEQGYTTLTQPEGAATTEWLRKVRAEELNGKPFAVGMDVHGPVPAGFILLHDQGNDPQKLERMVDLGLRIRQNMEETMPPTNVLDSFLDQLSETARQNIPDSREIGTTDQTAWRNTGIGRWAFVTHIADALSYTAANTWGGWMNSNSGLDAVSLSYEINCRAGGAWHPADYQIWVDNMRAVFETGVVTAAAFDKMTPGKFDIQGRVGFYEHGDRVTHRDGNPSPPPRHYPNHPLLRQIKQAPYDVSNTDFFRDLSRHTKRPLREVRGTPDANVLDGLDTFVVSDTQVADVDSLKSFVNGGGNLVLTDGALKMLPKLIDLGTTRIPVSHGYVGYSDLQRNHPLAHDLLVTARQMYDPTGLGYPLLMERDGYWQEGDEQSGSTTFNSAPIYAVDRDAWEAAGGVTVGTVDPPAEKETSEGQAEDLTNIGLLEQGKGRIVIFGALLPQPTEDYPHWFGLNGYTISAAGQTMLLRALNWGG